MRCKTRDGTSMAPSFTSMVLVAMSTFGAITRFNTHIHATLRTRKALLVHIASMAMRQPAPHMVQRPLDQAHAT